MNPLRLLVGASLLATLATGLRGADTPSPISADDLAFFNGKILPVLEERCYKCHSHSAKRIKGDLLLDSREALLRGGPSGPAVVPGRPDRSSLIQAILYTDADLQMPPEEHGGKLSDQEIANFVEWVRRGAPDPRKPIVLANGASPYSGGSKDHWSLLPVKKPAIPAIRNTTWAQSPIDHFILAKLETAGLQPNPIADKRALIRRVTFDLTGLPPTEIEIQLFLQDKSPDAFTKVVDRLLASPAYGERWARYWLDVARYSDTKGDTPKRDDPRYPHAWTYRDYVIESFNTDKPYNQFIIEQLAADRLVAEEAAAAKAKKQPPPADQSVLAALGFLRLGNQFDGRRDDIIADQIDVTTKAFLGLTVACARCHDHKFDPIPIKDYYSLYGVFANSAAPKTIVQEPTLLTQIPKTSELLDYMTKAAALQKEDAAIQQQYAEMRRAKDKDPMKRRELQREETRVQRAIGDLESSHPGAPARAYGLTDVPRPVHYPVLLRGEVGNKGPIVPRRFLEALSPDPQNRPEWTKGSGRLELAKAIADPKNPMTARVFVNRIWQEQFGLGFVDTPDDFGNNAARPANPELLDWLAASFVENGWSVKHLLRTIVLSSAYQQSSASHPQGVQLDPDNKLLWRANLRRLNFEEMYDALLAISGTLDRTLGGKSITPDQEGFGKRRALYTFIDRRNPPELLTQFDFPNPDVASGRRYDTTVPQQALFLMNSPLVIETARQLTHRTKFTSFATDEERVTSLYLAIFQREPSAQEIKLGLQYVRANPAGTAFEVTESSAAKTSREKFQEERKAKVKKADYKGKNGDPRPIGSTIPHGGPEDAWTKLAHALFQANEAMFIN